MKRVIKEDFVNATEKHFCGSSEWYEPGQASKGELFADLQQEYGRCVSAMYRDTEDGGAVKIGWVFQKYQEYTDCAEKYLAETWVTLGQCEPENINEYGSVIVPPGIAPVVVG